ncbi:MAG: PDZ domain-containing protein, partial [Ignavibacteria bacterium]|nr:PDZ domain-containing protein [Ignavibacteria bacterium]
AGLKVYDIIIGINNFKINNETTMIGKLQEFRPGDVLDMKVIRDGKQSTLKLKLERRR